MSKKGYKAMNKDMTCRGFQFQVGNTYSTSGIRMCSEGYHFCEKVMDVYHYYPRSPDTVVCEVEAVGDIERDGDKLVTNQITILRRLSDRELLELHLGNWNSGDRNTGDQNSGDWNSGYGNTGNRNSGYWNSGYGNCGNRNSGDQNTGKWNSGDRNTGDQNSGDGNSGYWNSGDWNSGNRNSGYGNTGNRNSGDWNSGDRNSGYFNTETPIFLFNKPSDLKYTVEFENRIRSLKVKPIVEWVPESLMSEKEKSDFPSHKTTGGFLRKTDRMDWRFLTKEDKEFIKSLPNFDDEVFKKISGGVSLLEEIEIVVNGVTKYISKEKAKELGLVE